MNELYLIKHTRKYHRGKVTKHYNYVTSNHESMLESEKVGIISSLKDLKLKLEELNEKVSPAFL